jgi:hypothetical protein
MFPETAPPAITPAAEGPVIVPVNTPDPEAAVAILKLAPAKVPLAVSAIIHPPALVDPDAPMLRQRVIPAGTAIVAISAGAPLVRTVTGPGTVGVPIGAAFKMIGAIEFVPVTTPPAVRLLPVIAPVAAKDVPVAAPMFGVTSVGLVSTTNFVPVPVWDAMEVALPTDVIGPVRLALVVTVAALPEMFVWSPVFVLLRLLPVTAPVAVTVPPMVAFRPK